MSDPNIQEAKRRLPLPALMAQLGDGESAKKSALCPFHDDKSNSFSVLQDESGAHRWRCFAGCGNGDEIDYIAKRKGLANGAAIHEFLKLAGAKDGSSSPRREVFNWQRCVEEFTDAEAEKLAKWRSLSVGFVRWLRSNRRIGLLENQIAFPNHDTDGNVVSAHVKLVTGKWKFEPKGQRTAPLIFGDVANVSFVLAFESQWDAFAAMDQLGWHENDGLPDSAVVITRGSDNGKLVAGLFLPQAVVYAFKQNDETKNGRNAADNWLSDVVSHSGCRVLNVATPEPHKDLNDWTRAGATKADIEAARIAAKLAKTESPKTETQSATVRFLTLQMPDEILGMVFDESDRILGDRLLAKGQSLVIAGQGGAGKSRILLQLLASVTTERQFFRFDTAGGDIRWLVLQTENSNRRLQDDLKSLKCWLGKDWRRFADRVVIHTLENDDDGFVSLENPENQRLIERAIESGSFGGVVVDPLNDFAIGDLSKDADMKATLQSLSRLCRRGRPDRALIALHHALVGRSGAVKATGYDRGSFARNSKALFAWTRGQINLAPVDPDSNERLIVACGKCSNGKEFETFAVRLNPTSMIYEVDPTVDVSQWQAEMTGAANREPLMTPARVAELCLPLSTKADLAKAIMADCGCYRGSAYRYIKRATGRTIKVSKDDTYSQK